MYLVRERVPDWKEHPFHLPAVRHLGTFEFHPKVTFLIGENGSGKSTLLEALAVSLGMNAEGGNRNLRFSTRDSHSKLTDSLRVGKVAGKAAPDSYFLRAESFYNVATDLEIQDQHHGGQLLQRFGGKSLHEQSHGESFMALFANRFTGQGLYLLDEPEAALSAQKQMTFLSIMHNYVRLGSQFVIATHSPILLAYPEAQIFLLDSEGIHLRKYEETDNYQITRNFLNRTPQILKILMDNEEGQSSC
ncbi:AAA family ATPase [Telmatocola sphagniphila]|nr:AAA family ATPase [Telmatocola sphagniphila]